MRVYVAHRLYAAHDRWLAGLVSKHLRDTGEAEVFLPYCDTDEHSVSPPGKGYKLFRADLDALPEAEVVVALLHGPGYDDGVCFEIGFAHALGIPVIAVTSDFLSFAPVARPAASRSFSDPLLDAICADVVIEHDPAVAVDLCSDARYLDFAAGQATVCEALAARVVARVREVRPRGVGAASEPARQTVYVEPDFYRAGLGAGDLVEAVGHEGRRLVAGRALSEAGVELADRDLAALAGASVVVVDGHGPEASPGAAIALGFAAAAGRRSVLFFSGPVTSLAHGREPTGRNLMVFYGASVLARSLAEVSQAVETWIPSAPALVTGHSDIG